MALIICSECGKQISDKAGACPNCGCPINSDTIVKLQHNYAESQPSDPLPLKETMKFLACAKGLEETIFTLSNTWNMLENKVHSLGHNRQIQKPVKRKAELLSPFFLLIAFLISYPIVLLIFTQDIGDTIVHIIDTLLIFTLFFGCPEEIIYSLIISAIVSVLLFSGINISIAISDSNDFERKMQHYKTLCNEDNQRVQNELQQIKILKTQQKEIEIQLNENKSLLKKLYACDVVAPNYRGMVPVITMLEYLKTGRCNRLKGAHGAYDTYSYEEKQNQIIGKLDVVISKLNEIKESQYMLYQAIQDSNEISNEIYAQSERLIQTNNEISKNTALVAYNTEVIKRNTQISAYIDVFRY